VAAHLLKLLCQQNLAEPSSPRYWQLWQAHTGPRNSCGLLNSLCDNYTNKLCGKWAEVIQIHLNPNGRAYGQGDATHRKYREDLTVVDRFTALLFTATGTLPSEAHTDLPMNQYAWWPITFEIEILWSFLTALCFKASAVRFMCGILLMICQQWAAAVIYISRLFSVTISEQCVTSWCGIF
jgi:hypothetical protein